MYGLELTRGLSPMSMSFVISCVLPISSFPLEKTLEYFSQSTSKVDLVPGVMSASCRSTLLSPGTSTGDVMKALSRGMIGILYLACFLRGMWFQGPRIISASSSWSARACTSMSSAVSWAKPTTLFLPK